MLISVVVIIAIPFVIGATTLLLPPRWSGRLALLPPLAVLLLGIPLWSAVSDGAVLLHPVQWFPSLGLSADLRVDRLGALFVLMIGGIGLGVVQYARHYFAGKERSSFWAALLSFMGAMLGIVLSDSLLLFFVFWELTTITSALLIGMEFDRADARRGAVQAFLVTGAGGLALLAGIVLLGQSAGIYTFSGLEARADLIVADPRHVGPLLLLLTGAFTKSAQFPFHFWLPGAMAAPAPVSAYLHSATMVKAGIFLLGRLLPVFQSSWLWEPVLSTVGLTTFLVGAWLAVRAYDLKQLLAYTTVAYLGMLTALYGYYPGAGSQGELLNVLNHAVYKSSLFLLIGWLDKTTGTRDVSLLEREKWVQREPFGAVLVGTGALAMLGLPFLLGFMSKEAFFATLSGGKLTGLTLGLVIASLASALSATAALKLAVGTFWGWRPPPPGRGGAHVSPWLLAVPAVLLLPQVLGGVVPGWFLGAVLEPGGEWPRGIAVWRSADLKLALSLGILAAGVAGFVCWRWLAALPGSAGMAVVAAKLADGVLAITGWWSRAAQAGGHPRYVMVILIFAASLVVGALWNGTHGLGWPPLRWGPDLALAAVPAVVIATGALLTVVVPDRITKVVMLAIVGYGMAVLYVLFRAPDLALTQLLVETISLILLLLTFRRLPRLRPDSRGQRERLVHALVACATGAGLASLAWVAGSHAAQDPAGADHVRLSLPLAKGANVVNVILVDFRGVDTLGEIVVLMIAAFGSIALFRAGRSSAWLDRLRRDAAPRGTVRGPEGMMRSLILSKVARAVLPVVTLFALYLLIRGHNEPGGGFIAGLVTASGLVLQALAFGVEPTYRRLVRVLRVAGPVGLSVALSAAAIGPLRGDPWLTHYHGYVAAPGREALHTSTTLLFDVGVYILVVGAAATLISVFALEDA